MMTRIIILCLLTAAIIGCANKPRPAKSIPAFQSVEISYTNGWERNLGFIIDSSKRYFFNYKEDTTGYGTLPDTLFAAVDTFAGKILSDTSMHSTEIDCYDCSVVAIRVFTNTKTVTVRQAGAIDRPIMGVINSLQHFQDSGRHQKMHGIVLFDTRNLVVPPPPKISD